jgi:uncharacterized protein with NRDE domain
MRRPGHDWPLVLAANRDEMIARPAKPPGRHWPEQPKVIAGLDVLAGGSWLGLNGDGVVAGILNRIGSLGPAPGQRSRGELVLAALQEANARTAAAALARRDPRAYRTFNLIIADAREAFWLRHAEERGAPAIDVRALETGLAMIAASELDDTELPRLKRFRPRFAAAPVPDPGSADWARWEALLADDTEEPPGDPTSAMRFSTASGFATVSSAMIALPAAPSARAVFRYRAWQPAPTAWEDVAV